MSILPSSNQIRPPTYSKFEIIAISSMSSKTYEGCDDIRVPYRLKAGFLPKFLRILEMLEMKDNFMQGGIQPRHAMSDWTLENLKYQGMNNHIGGSSPHIQSNCMGWTSSHVKSPHMGWISLHVKSPHMGWISLHVKLPHVSWKSLYLNHLVGLNCMTLCTTTTEYLLRNVTSLKLKH